ncbi:hypothetical protein [Brasilonema sp. UFV-L1]|uniref:hypothetical protein n=1 Tax=Brasilonema sp. UFV-L1 TaxID=2234130 RepID=UPI00145DB831|nr:hypothetical protein [Brasilonema sp. UFV-L1]NMG09745.1 hypothetical protein [Brasilonema sp. UFV-L1]
MYLRETLASPQKLINAVQGRAKEILQQSYVVISVFGCVEYGTGEPWDTGECLGYSIYCPDELMDELDQYLGYISAVGISLAKKAYKGDRRQPGGCMSCRASIIWERDYSRNFESVVKFNRSFLESCFK